MNIKKLIVKTARKSANIGGRVADKALVLSKKVENKATRILDGVDSTISVSQSVPFEKFYYNSLPEIIPIQPAMPAVGYQPTVTLLIPSLDKSSFFGGTATALIVSAKIAAKMKRRLRIVQTLKTGNGDGVADFLNQHGVPITKESIKVISVADRAYNRYGYLSMSKEDVFIASAWWDAHLLARLPLTTKFIYLVQDFEPIFYNNSDQYVLAEETYKADGFVPLCNTRLMHDFMKERGYSAFRNSLYFEPAVSLMGKIQTDGRTVAKKRLFIYGRPNVHRNLFNMALDAVNTAFTLGYLQKDEWECYMAGQDKISNLQLSSGMLVKNLGKMNLQDYYSFCGSVDVALTPMMAPHPNYPTLEFASVGSMVVTTKYANKTNLDAYSKNIIVSDTSTESLAGALNEAAKTSKSLRQKNLKSTIIQDSWDASLDTVLESLLSRL